MSNTWFQTPYDLSGKVKYDPPPLAANYSAPYEIVLNIPKKILIVGFGFIRLKRENGRAKILEEIYD